MTDPYVSRTQQLRDLVNYLTDTVQRHGGTMSQVDALRELGVGAGVFGPDAFYVINSAVADYRITHSLRTGELALLKAPK